MRADSVLPLFCRAVASVAVLLALSAPVAGFEGRVVAVTDGDTVTVLDAGRREHKVRVAGIDAPERRQAFGERAKWVLSDLVFGRIVEVVGDKKDRYGRRVPKLMVAEASCADANCPRNVDAGLRLVESGLAWWYRKYQREQSPDDRWSYERAEGAARDAGRGLWQDKDPISPWDWRRGGA